MTTYLDETEEQIRGAAGEEPPKGFHIIHISKLELRKPDWLVKGLIEKDSLGDFFADPESGKSLMAGGLGACVATGRDFYGRKVKQGAVLLIIGEGRGGLARRMKAWEIVNGMNLNDAPFYISNGPTSLCDPGSVDQILEAIESMPKEPPLALVIFDTLARNFGPGDENSTKDMTACIAAMDRIRMLYRCTVLVIHHSGHGDKSRARGAMALRGALDFEYRFDRDENGIIRMQATKMKDAERPEPLAFKIAAVDLGIKGDDGEPVTSAVLVPTEYVPPAKNTAGGKWQNLALKLLERLYTDYRNNPENQGFSPNGARVSVNDWVQVCKDAGVPKNRLSEVKLALQERKIIEIKHGYISRL